MAGQVASTAAFELILLFNLATYYSGLYYMYYYYYYSVIDFSGTCIPIQSLCGLPPLYAQMKGRASPPQ